MQPCGIIALRQAVHAVHQIVERAQRNMADQRGCQHAHGEAGHHPDHRRNHNVRRLRQGDDAQRVEQKHTARDDEHRQREDRRNDRREEKHHMRKLHPRRM